jgi:hypothetical protein
MDFDLERPTFDWAPWARASLWCLLALIAAGAAMLAARSDTGAQRLAALFGAPAADTQPQVSAPYAEARAAVETVEQELRRISGEVDELAAGQAKLATRLAALENTFDVTAAVPKPAGEARQDAGGGSAPTHASDSRTAPFGLDLGQAGSLEALRALWNVARAQHGAVLEGLYPLAALIDDPQSGGIAVRLVAGPIADASAAARVCSVIGATGRPCRPVPFEGQRLALR